MLPVKGARSELDCRGSSRSLMFAEQKKRLASMSKSRRVKTHRRLGL